MIEARKSSALLWPGIQCGLGTVFILIKADPLLPYFRMFSEPVGDGLAPRRTWPVGDLQGTLSHFLHHCQMGVGAGREW